MPSCESMHPLVVHFPIALLIVAPLLIVLGLAFRRLRAFLHAALVVMALGTAGAWVAVQSGEADARLVERTPALDALLQRHDEMAERTRTIFTVLTVVYAALLFVPAATKQKPRRLVEAATLGAFVLVWVAATAYLARTAKEGGLLVHRHGIHALRSGG